MIIEGDLVLPYDKICPNSNNCEYNKVTAEQALNVPYSRCPHSYPHNNIACGRSKCCPDCIPFDQSTVTLNKTSRVTKVLTLI